MSNAPRLIDPDRLTLPLELLNESLEILSGLGSYIDCDSDKSEFFHALFLLQTSIGEVSRLSRVANAENDR